MEKSRYRCFLWWVFSRYIKKNWKSKCKRGCDTGCCGLCSIWIDEKPTLSCSTLSVRANKRI